MAVLLAGAAWAGLILWLVMRMLRQLAAHRATSLDGVASPAAAPPLPEVAIIVPARNEIANIAECLAALSAQRGLSAGSSITVVDDGSQDGTGAAVAAAARHDPRIALVAAGRLPPGWMGKPHACWRGACETAAEWLCFVDADVRAAPALLEAALGAAERHRIDMLSLHPFQVLGSFWERLIIPAGLVLVACAKDLRLIEDPRSPEISANGQFLLFRRAVYDAVGGHAAVRGEIAEDKALAAAVKRAGWHYRMLFAENLARTRMYSDLASLWEGLSKNATEIMGRAAATVAVTTAATVIAWSAVLLPVLTGLMAARHPAVAPVAGFALALLGSLAVAGVQLGTTRHFRIPLWCGLLFPLAYTTVAALAWHSAALRRDGRVTWKGRTYRLDRNA
jgi:chlorobactene glucosyltransferase